MQLTPSVCRFIVRGIPQGHVVGGTYLIWEIPIYMGPNVLTIYSLGNYLPSRSTVQVNVPCARRIPQGNPVKL